MASKGSKRAPAPPAEEKPASVALAAPPLDAPELYLNRELSLLAFDERVLAQATRQDTPLLERLRFLTIASTNLDEFFEVRVSSVKQQAVYGVAYRLADGLTAKDTLAAISVRAHALVAEQYRVLNQVILPELAERGIRLLKRGDWTKRQRAWVSDYFAREVMPVLTPTAVDPAHPFPLTINKGLAFIVQVRGQDAFGRRGGVAIVLAAALPRTIKLPDGVAEGPWDFVLLSSVIHANIESLFPGMKVRACHQFRVTRNSDLWVDEEEIDDLLSAIAGELPRRNYGDAVRLEVDDTCPRELVDFLLDRLDLEEEDLYQVDGPVNLHRVAALYDLVDEPSLKYRPFIPSQPRRLLTADPDLFATLRKGDVLLHHPYQSFGPVLELLRQAAMDPAVLAIKMTLYRTGAQSPVAAVLLDAALRGKEVTVVVELRARFDEKANIDLATRMKEAGAHVLYGIVGWKTHAKMLLIVRREANGLRRYVHVGTGNYHARTALAYTDLGLLSARQDLGEDVHDLFMQLTGFGRATPLAKLIAAPFTMIDELVRFIDAEADAARAGKKSGIIAKMNSLSEPTVIRALYRASQAGVPIELVVRGICALRPKVPGVSETIRVRSIVGRFLEHSRVFWFHHGGAEKVLIGSADWMPRNLYRRVECLVPVEAAALARRVVDEALTPYLTDDRDSWELGPDGTYTPSPPGGTRSAQQALLAELTREHEGF